VLVCVGSGCVHAVPCQRPVHNGRSGVELSLHNGWTRLCDARSDQQADDAAPEPDPSARRCIRLHHRLVLHVPSLHAHETTVSVLTNDVLFIAGLVEYWPARIHAVAPLTYTVVT